MHKDMNTINYPKIAFTITFLLQLSLAMASPMDLHFENQEQLDSYLQTRNQLIDIDPDNATNYLERADALFLNHKFDQAVDDYSTALKLDENLIEAYFGRGMALARAGWLEDSITDLDIYIGKNPNSSKAYTKRGVRYLWLGEKAKARNDLEKAIQLDPMNAEAHDDLGVIFAQQMQYYQAADHFISAIEIEPNYQKAYHNMALISHITDKDTLALYFVDKSLSFAPNSRESWLLKVQILKALGFTKEAEEAQEEAEFLAEGNWSENVPLQ
jgi:tetratricopeptide (TPR) repeat protein